MSSHSSATTVSTSTPLRSTRVLKRTLSRTSTATHLTAMQMCNSSDTEEPWTPPQKRFRFMKDEDSPTYKSFHGFGRGDSLSPLAGPSFSPVSFLGLRSPASSRGDASPSKRRRRVSSVSCDLTTVLKKCSSSKAPIETQWIKEVKTFPRGEADGLMSIKQVFSRAKALVKTRFDRAGKKILATELYLEWLEELDFVVSAIENLLAAKVPGTRRRISGLGRLSFTILFQLMDEFLCEVDSHHDGWSKRTAKFSERSQTSMYPETMTIIEESHDNSTDVRSELAVQEAEELLANYDLVMADAVRRYKIECGTRSNVGLADAIGSKESMLSKACCLLCEQTGYGSNDNDRGDTLMQETRIAMQEWHQEFGSEASDDLENDELTND